MNQAQLEKEAAFQDAKITGHSKRTEGKFYLGPAAEYRIQSLDSLMGDLTGKKVLDLGAGDGWNTLRMLSNGACVYAIDISPESIRHIEQCASDYIAQGSCHCYVMDATHMHFEDNSFDIVVGYGILHHILNYEQTIPEILRVLKPDGRAYFVEPLGINPFINLYRRLTPQSRTVDEKPLSIKDLSLIRKLAPRLKCHFYELLTLLSKPLIIIKQHRLANKLEAKLVTADNKLLISKSNRITFWQKLAWFVILEF